jgi:exopolysaccharide biosynthesis polyprenyl glycosylphosphotransferase
MVIPFPVVATHSGYGTTAGRCRLNSCLGVIERVSDFAAILLATLVAWSIAGWVEETSWAWVPATPVQRYAALFSLLFVLLLEKHGEYRPYLSLLAVRETERLLRTMVESFSLAVAVAYLAAPQLSPGFVPVMLALVPLALCMEKAWLRAVIGHLRNQGYGNCRAVILGAGPLAKNVFSLLSRSPKLGIEPIAVVDEDAAFDGVQIHASSYGLGRAALVLAGPLSAGLFRNLQASMLIIADPRLDGPETLEIMARAASLGVTSLVASRDYLEPGAWFEYSDWDGIVLARVGRERESNRYQTAQRVLDVIGAGVALLALAPAMALIAALVRSTSPGPALFKHQRAGRNGRLFWMYKFRSMYLESAQYDFSPRRGDDSRITPLGRFLRRTCLDELPQLWNVLRGEMSLVGPRPEMPFIAKRYSAFERQRLAVKPGLTGLWQLSGDRNYLIHENIEYDLYYIRNRNLFMDFAILLHTLIFAARGI